MKRKALIQAMKDSISEVLETMFFSVVCFPEISQAKDQWVVEGKQMAAVELNFNGPFSGSFSLFMPEALALSLTAGFIGTDEEEVSGDHVEETVKEILNMIAGNTFYKLGGHADFHLGIPVRRQFEQLWEHFGPDGDIFIPVLTTDNCFALEMSAGLEA
jgi:CheY-specific phosphatase CheX